MLEEDRASPDEFRRKGCLMGIRQPAGVVDREGEERQVGRSRDIDMVAEIGWETGRQASREKWTWWQGE